MITLEFQGLNRLVTGFAFNPELLEKHLEWALKRSIAMVETESKRVTPWRTGHLYTSIGGAAGYRIINPSQNFASVGTNVEYAEYVHEHHKTKSRYMERGAKASMNYIEKVFGDALKNYARQLVIGL